jgi:hypothetical protein
MPLSGLRIAAPVALALLTSCSGPSASTGADGASAEFFWSAAKETYAAGDYMKTLDDLDHLMETHSAYTARAVPWSLVLTGGLANGYMELADNYAAGARVNKAQALAFRRKANEYRTMANPLALRLAQNVEKMDQLPAGAVPVAFPMPKGSAAVPELLTRIGDGEPLSPLDTDRVQTLVLQRNVLLAVCEAVGSTNDMAKAEDVLTHISTASHTTFGKAVAQMLENESKLYSRNQLDEPEKLAILHQRAQTVLSGEAQAGGAMLVEAKVAATAKGKKH